MLGIFDDEQRGSGPIAPDPFGTGRLCAGAASRKALWGPSPRRLPLLTPAQSRSRQKRALSVHRP